MCEEESRLTIEGGETMQDFKIDRRNFLKAGGVSALGTQMALAGQSWHGARVRAFIPGE